MFREILLKNSIDIGDFGLSATDQLFIEVKNHFYNYNIYKIYDLKKISSCAIFLYFFTCQKIKVNYFYIIHNYVLTDS